MLSQEKCYNLELFVVYCVSISLIDIMPWYMPIVFNNFTLDFIFLFLFYLPFSFSINHFYFCIHSIKREFCSSICTFMNQLSNYFFAFCLCLPSLVEGTLCCLLRLSPKFHNNVFFFVDLTTLGTFIEFRLVGLLS